MKRLTLTLLLIFLVNAWSGLASAQINSEVNARINEVYLKTIDLAVKCLELPYGDEKDRCNATVKDRLERVEALRKKIEERTRTLAH